MTDRLHIEPQHGEEGRSGDSLNLTLSGELDYTNSTTLDDCLEPLLLDTPAHLVLDVTDLTFCDSAGLSVLIGAHHRLARAGGDMTLRGVRGALRRVVGITGLDTLFIIEPAR